MPEISVPPPERLRPAEQKDSVWPRSVFVRARASEREAEGGGMQRGGGGKSETAGRRG